MVTSPNMGNAPYGKGINLGVVCRGGGVTGKVRAHFDALIARGVSELVE